MVECGNRDELHGQIGRSMICFPLPTSLCMSSSAALYCQRQSCRVRRQSSKNERGEFKNVSSCTSTPRAVGGSASNSASRRVFGALTRALDPLRRYQAALIGCCCQVPAAAEKQLKAYQMACTGSSDSISQQSTFRYSVLLFPLSKPTFFIFIFVKLAVRGTSLFLSLFATLHSVINNTSPTAAVQAIGISFPHSLSFIP
jgi:hypothetical protein